MILNIFRGFQAGDRICKLGIQDKLRHGIPVTKESFAPNTAEGQHRSRYMVFKWTKNGKYI